MGWSLAIKDMSWVERTREEVDFLVQALGLRGRERILDLACGFGRHALELARRGCSVVGVDFTEAYVEDARAAARAESLPVELVHADVRDLTYREEFDVVLNMADGAIGPFPGDGDPGTRLYGQEELKRILAARGLEVLDAFGGYDVAVPASPDHLMLVVVSRKR